MTLAYGIGGLLAVPPPVIKGQGIPPSTFVGQLGQQYFDTTTAPYSEYVYNGTSWIQQTAGAAGVFTLSAQGGSGVVPLVGNYDFSGLASTGAITFSSAGAGLMKAAVNVDGTTVTVNASNQLQANTGVVWRAQATAATLAKGTGFIDTNPAATTLTFTMPATAAVGDEFAIVNAGLNAAGRWVIQMNTGQTANYISSSTSVAGTITSNERWTECTIICSVANTAFLIIDVEGSVTLA